LGTKWINNHTTLALAIAQFRGYKNCNAPENLYNKVKGELYKFNGMEVHTKQESNDIFQIDDFLDNPF
jgi:hypothetical protein